MAFPTGYTKYQEVTIDNTKVTADQTDFPVYVDLSDLDKAGSDIFDTCRTDGGDIRVTKSDGTTELPREIVDIDTTAKTGELHFKFSGTLSSSSDTTVRIWYNGTDTEPAASATYGSENVWTGYAAVYHLNESSGNLSDSTSGGVTLTANGTPTYSATGQIGTAITFDGSTDYFANAGTAVVTTRPVSFSAWANATDTLGLYTMALVGENLAGGDFMRIMYHTTSSGVMRTQDNFNSGSDQLDNGTNATGWRHNVGVLTTSTFENFQNGSSTGSASKGNHTYTLNRTAIGALYTSTASQLFKGTLDEVRFHNGTLSSTWIATEYNNQNSASTFYSTSDEQTSGGGPTIYNALSMCNF